jgi:ATP-dependent Clp protease ATP-binding subunit ClpC
VKEEGSATIRYEKMKNKILEEVKHLFRPEFLNRIDEVVVFHALELDEIKQIVALELAKVVKELENQRVTLEATDAAKELIAKEGWDPQFGARPLRRAIQRLVEDPLSEELLRGTFKIGDHIQLDVEDGKSVFRKIGEPLKPPTPQPTGP